MAQQQNSGNQSLPTNVVQDLIKTEQMKISQRAEELKLRAKEIETNERLAKVSMEYQYKVLEKKPRQHKETTIVYTSCVAGILIIFLGFVGYLVVNGQVAFVEKFLGWISYLVISVLSFFAGRFSKKSGSKEKDMEDAEVVE